MSNQLSRAIFAALTGAVRSAVLGAIDQGREAAPRVPSTARAEAAGRWELRLSVPRDATGCAPANDQGTRGAASLPCASLPCTRTASLRTLGLVLLLCVRASAGEFESANQLYDQGRFSEARQRYQALVDAGEWSANLFHNLGNANHRMGASGLAMLNYERALTLDPSHPEATANLRLLRDQTNAKLPAAKWSDTVFGALSLDGWTLLAAAAGWMAVFCLGTPLVIRRAAAPALVFVGVISLFVAAAAGAGVWHRAQDRDAALIIARQAEARLEPADRAALADVLPAGSRVRIRSEHGPWIYCELPGRGLGWLPAASLERVRMSRS